MKLFNRIKSWFQGLTGKTQVEQVTPKQGIKQAIKQGFEKIKGLFKKKQKPVEPTKPTTPPPPDNYKSVMEKYILGLKDDYAIYYRKANGQFDVYMYNVESLKWETLDIIDQMERVTKPQFDEIQSIVKKVIESSPSSKTEDDYKDMFANINAVLKGGTYIMQTLGPVSTDGTPFEEMDK